MRTDVTEPEDAFQSSTEILLAELKGAAERKFRMNRWIRPLSRMGIGGLVLSGLVSWLHLPILAEYAPTFALLRFLALGIVCTSWIPEFVLLKRVDKSKARLKALILELRQDVRAVGPIAQLCHHTQYFSVADIAVEPLLHLLPLMKVGDARYISDSQMQALLALLVAAPSAQGDTNRFHNLPLAILKALEQSGDSRAIETVRRLATGRSDSWYCPEAQKCLAVLEQYGEERDRHRFLLLPSSLETGKVMLLRPTVPQTEAQPELLLRAAKGEERT